MANNLSSNQQYLLSLVQQNNPEFLSKFLNEGSADRARTHSDPYDSGISDEQRARWAARDEADAAEKERAKNNPYGAVQMAKARRGEYDPDENIANKQKSRLKYSDEKQEKIDTLKQQHYSDLLQRTANMDPETMDARTAGQLLLYKIESGQNEKTPEQQLRDISMGGNFEKSDEQKQREKDLRNATATAYGTLPNHIDKEPKTFGEKFKNMSADEIGSIAARAAKREADEIASNKPISPFYKTTRKEFAAKFGRDYDASGGANPENMRSLINIKTDLPGRLKNIETGWQDKMSWEAQLAAGEKQKNLWAKIGATLVAKDKADEENPVYDYVASDFDVPPSIKPGEDKDSAGRQRTIPTSPINTHRETAWIFNDFYKQIMGIDLPHTSERKKLSGKSVNQKINNRCFNNTCY